jgi:hypothetical protein
MEWIYYFFFEYASFHKAAKEYLKTSFVVFISFGVLTIIREFLNICATILCLCILLLYLYNDLPEKKMSLSDKYLKRGNIPLPHLEKQQSSIPNCFWKIVSSESI